MVKKHTLLSDPSGKGAYSANRQPKNYRRMSRYRESQLTSASNFYRNQGWRLSEDKGDGETPGGPNPRGIHSSVGFTSRTNTRFSR